MNCHGMPEYKPPRDWIDVIIDWWHSIILVVGKK